MQNYEGSPLFSETLVRRIAAKYRASVPGAERMVMLCFEPQHIGCQPASNIEILLLADNHWK
jgi:hypothetical protein